MSLTKGLAKGRAVTGAVALVMVLALLVPVAGGAAALLSDASSAFAHTAVTSDCPHQEQHLADPSEPVSGCTGPGCAQCQCFTSLLGQASGAHSIPHSFASAGLSGQVEQRFSRLERPPKYPVV